MVVKKTKKKEKKASKTSKTEPAASSKQVIKAYFSGEGVFSNTKAAISMHSQSRFGELKDGKIYYSIPEALYLAEKKKMNVFFKGKKLSFEKFLDKAKEIDKRILTKLIVFRDMRNRGYVIKTALKFGAEFRVYDRGAHPGEEHARWILYPVNESSELTWHEFAAKNRVAHSTKKNLLIAIVDEEHDVTYYEIKWTRP
jgi:tRNA-intron endonuclease